MTRVVFKRASNHWTWSCRSGNSGKKSRSMIASSLAVHSSSSRTISGCLGGLGGGGGIADLYFASIMSRLLSDAIVSVRGSKRLQKSRLGCKKTL